MDLFRKRKAFKTTCYDVMFYNCHPLIISALTIFGHPCLFTLGRPPANRPQVCCIWLSLFLCLVVCLSLAERCLLLCLCLSGILGPPHVQHPTEFSCLFVCVFGAHGAYNGSNFHCLVIRDESCYSHVAHDGCVNLACCGKSCRSNPRMDVLWTVLS